MNPTDITIEILKDIRAEIQGSRGETASLRTDFQGLREDFKGLREEFRELGTHVERIERRQVEADIRLSTEIVSVVGVMHEVRDLLRDGLRMRPRLDDHERRITELEKKP